MNAQLETGRNHNRPLHSPLSATRGNKDVHQPRTQETHQREGLFVGNLHTPLADGTRNGSTFGRKARHDSHNPCIKRKLQQDARTRRGSFRQRTHVLDRGLVQENAQHHEEHDDRIQIKISSLNKQGNAQIAQAQQDHQARKQATVLQTGCRGPLDFSPLQQTVRDRLCLFFQQCRIYADHFGTLRVHQSIDNNEGQSNRTRNDEVETGENGL